MFFKHIATKLENCFNFRSYIILDTLNYTDMNDKIEFSVPTKFLKRKVLVFNAITSKAFLIPLDFHLNGVTMTRFKKMWLCYAARPSLTRPEEENKNETVASQGD